MSRRTTRMRTPLPACRTAGSDRHYTSGDIDAAFDTGYRAGQADEAERHRQRDEQLRRLAEAVQAAEAGDPSLLDQMAREQGMTPPTRVDAAQMVADIERWLGDQEGPTR
ncbi:hypothetical protein [Micromonospora sp. WMMD1082]|uniref:hypothetical protein n=1 Tax=Micromonospora sp. WMMD1082 TaxID=3016104 RepID=UPI002417B012|nr:hypothetical protein [Micromonospora sp. WMMD1082]MDG4792436.1 hypothetical protein [Micromonospora sp. WMMD1082]